MNRVVLALSLIIWLKCQNIATTVYRNLKKIWHLCLAFCFLFVCVLGPYKTINKAKGGMGGVGGKAGVLSILVSACWRWECLLCRLIGHDCVFRQLHCTICSLGLKAFLLIPCLFLAFIPAQIFLTPGTKHCHRDYKYTCETHWAGGMKSKDSVDYGSTQQYGAALFPGTYSFIDLFISLLQYSPHIDFLFDFFIYIS